MHNLEQLDTPRRFEWKGSHRGELLASAGQDGLVVLWQPDRNQHALSQSRFDSPVSQIVWSPNDHYLAAGTEDGLVTVLQIN